MTDYTIGDLRLPCDEHGKRDRHPLPSPSLDRKYCPGGRVPTQAEINALAKPDYEAAGWALLAMTITKDLDDDGVEAMALAAVDAALGGGE